MEKLGLVLYNASIIGTALYVVHLVTKSRSKKYAQTALYTCGIFSAFVLVGLIEEGLRWPSDSFAFLIGHWVGSAFALVAIPYLLTLIILGLIKLFTKIISSVDE